MERSSCSVAILNKQQLMKFDGTSMVPLFNTVAGVRMEERSPEVTGFLCVAVYYALRLVLEI
jgi:hypothetical protein